MKNKTFKLLLGCALCASFIIGVPAQAKMYKWKDENGQTHYGDHVPERYLKTEREEMNSQGAVVKKTERAKTQAELDEEKRQQEIAKQEAAKMEEQRRRDRVLLDTYTTERDLVIARDARLDAVDSQIKLSESIIESAHQKLSRTEKQIETIKSRNKKVPADIYAKLNREKQQLETHQKVADGHKQKREAISKQFDGYIARFNELKALKEERRSKASQGR